ncbi:NAD(P)-binding protein [Naviculisporaceae sp. PSN 640]
MVCIEVFGRIGTSRLTRSNNLYCHTTWGSYSESPTPYPVIPIPNNTMATPKNEPVCLGNVLVIGGCGFLGHHIVKQLLALPYPSSITSITVMSRNPTKNLLTSTTGALLTYHQGDITSPNDVSHIVNLSRPTTVINTASPVAYIDHVHAPDYEKVNVLGNQLLLSACASITTVKAYIYTSSGPIIAGSGGAYSLADETHPTLADLPFSKSHDPYHLAKARGDALILSANSPPQYPFLTATIRPTAMYGEGDTQMIANLLNVLRTGQQTVWLGSNTALMDSVYVGSVARAHILAAKALLSPNAETRNGVAGQAFNITDDSPFLPWTFFRLFWIAMGDTTPLSKVWMIPDWVVLKMAEVAEWWSWGLSWGKLRPKLLIKERIEFLVYTRTYCIDKARERLGYEPEGDISGCVRRAVEWALGEWPEGSNTEKGEKAN